MPKYLVEMHDGRKFQVEADSQPTEAEVLAQLGESSAPQSAPPVERGGLLHPATSMLAPELETARGALDAATATPHGQPIMARSRTGSLYPSETGTGAVDAAKHFAKGAGDEVLSQAEGLTSPLGMVAGVASALPMKRILSGTLRTVGESLQSPNSLTRQVKSAAGKLATNVADRISPPAEIPPPEPPSGPHMDRSVPMRPSELTPQQLTERVQQGSGMPAQTTGQVTGQLRPVLPPEFAPMDAPVAQAGGAPMPSTDPHARLLEKLGGQEPPLQQPRIATGAEKVGRDMGLSKQDVRNQTTPILGEQPGEASPIFPKEVLGRIVDTVKALPMDQREAYVQAATSGKAQWQIETVRRTLEHMGLLVPAAIGIEPMIRERLQSLMHSGTP